MAEMPEPHTFKSYDGALSELRLGAHAMGVLVAGQVETAVRALLEADREAAEQVLAREQRINEYQTQIEAESFRLLARQSPVLVVERHYFDQPLETTEERRPLGT